MVITYAIKAFRSLTTISRGGSSSCASILSPVRSFPLLECCRGSSLDPYCSLLSIQCTEWFKEQNLLFALAVSIWLRGQVLHALELHFFIVGGLVAVVSLFLSLAFTRKSRRFRRRQYAMKGLSGNTSLQRFEDWSIERCLVMILLGLGKAGL